MPPKLEWLLTHLVLLPEEPLFDGEEAGLPHGARAVERGRGGRGGSRRHGRPAGAPRRSRHLVRDWDNSQSCGSVADFSVASVSKNTIMTTESVVNIVFFEMLGNSAKKDHQFMQSLIIQKFPFAFLGCRWSLEMSIFWFFETLATEKSATGFNKYTFFSFPFE